MTKRQDRSARISELCTALRNERLASIRDDLADMGYKGAQTLNVQYFLSPEYGWPVFTALSIDGELVVDSMADKSTPLSEHFSGSDTQDILNALLIEDYDPDIGDASLDFDFHDLPPEL